MTIGRNERCYCGSGKKYKKCHLASDEAEARTAGAHAGASGQGRVPTGAGPRGGELAAAMQRLTTASAGSGEAQQMLAFSQPLIAKAGDDIESVGKALALGSVFWQLAVTPKAEREQAIATMLRESADAAARVEFLSLATTMIARHEAMFPELHGARG